LFDYFLVKFDSLQRSFWWCFTQHIFQRHPVSAAGKDLTICFVAAKLSMLISVSPSRCQAAATPDSIHSALLQNIA
jgi:hypothetical protein